MNNDLLNNILRFIVLALSQVLVFSHIDLFGFINPYIYILFIITFPYRKESRMLYLLAAFLMGLTIDMFSDSGGVHAAASLTLAYIRPAVLRFCFGFSVDFQTLKLANTMPGQRILYFFISILTHHIILFSLEIFSFTNIRLIFEKTIFSSALTLILCLLFITLFSRKKT